MTSLAAAMVAAFVARGDLALGLGSPSGELVGGGYSRVTPPWRAVGEQAFAEGRWGPFTATVEFDRVLVIAAGEVVEQIRCDPAVLPPGSTWTQEAIVGVSGG